MKIRTGFVANSSSCSCIVSAEDNKFGMLFSSGIQLLTFKEYFDRFGENDIPVSLGFYSYSFEDDSKSRVKIVSDKKYLSLYKKTIHNVLPEAAEKQYNTLLSITREMVKFGDKKKVDYRSARTGKYNVFYDFIIDSQEAQIKKIKKAVYNLLAKSKYASMMYCYKEVEDNNTVVYDLIRDFDDEDVVAKSEKMQKVKTSLKNMFADKEDCSDEYYDPMYENEESLALKRMDYVDKMIGLKFRRVVSNH